MGSGPASREVAFPSWPPSAGYLGKRSKHLPFAKLARGFRIPGFRAILSGTVLYKRAHSALRAPSSDAGRKHQKMQGFRGLASAVFSNTAVPSRFSVKVYRRTVAGQAEF